MQHSRSFCGELARALFVQRGRGRAQALCSGTLPLDCNNCPDDTINILSALLLVSALGICHCHTSCSAVIPGCQHAVPGRRCTGACICDATIVGDASKARDPSVSQATACPLISPRQPGEATARSRGCHTHQIKDPVSVCSPDNDGRR